MKISRKNFIKTSAIVTGGFLFGFKKYPHSLLINESNGMKNIINNAGIYYEKGGTIGWYFTNEFVVVIDSQFPDSAENFLNLFKKKINRKIDILFNTHHHRDHTAGNYYLNNFVEDIIAHENVPMLQEKQNKGTENESKQVYARTTFNSEWKKDIGVETISAKFFGAAHTGGDSVIHFEKNKIAHLGDLVFNNCYPFIDPNGGGKIEGWVNVLNKVINHYPNNTTFIFGHADSNDNLTGDKKCLLEMRDYLDALLSNVEKEIKKGKSLAEIKELKYFDNFKHLKERWNGAFAMNLEAAYNELVNQ